MNLEFLKSSHGEEPVVVEGTFRATPERVFRAWTQAEDVMRWFGRTPGGLHSAEIDLRVGGEWRFAYGEDEGKVDVMRGEYLAVEPASRLEFTWQHERLFDDGRNETTPKSKVTLTIEPTPTGSILRLVHEAIAREAGRLGVGAGWNASFRALQDLVEQAE